MPATREELVQSLVDQMGSVIRAMRKGWRLPFGEFTLSGPQASILLFVARGEDGVSVKDLASFFDVTPGAVTQFIDTLVEKDMVRREEDPRDRRVLRIKLTDFARSRFSQFRRDHVGSMSKFFDALTDEEVGQLTALLARINIPSGTKECKTHASEPR